MNILSKIPAEAVNLEALLAVRNSAGNPGVEKLLCHLPRLNAGVMAIIADQTMLRLITPALLAEAAAAPEEESSPQIIHLMSDIINLCSLMGTGDAITQFRSIPDIRRRHRNAADEYARFLKQWKELTRFPNPPLAGNEQVTPITNTVELRQEGIEQHNCVGSYAEKIQKGRCSIYRVLWPERATLSISKGPDGCWEIQQLQLSYNRAVSQDTRQFVQGWFDQFTLSV